jgi:hypothetical protein
MHVETVGPLGTPVERSPWARVHLEPVVDGDSAFAPIAPNTARGGTEFRRLPRSMNTVEVEFQRR